MTASFALFLVGIVLALVLTIQGLVTLARVRVPYVGTNRWVMGWLARHANLKPSQTFLELGCGDGRVLVALAPRYPTTQFVGYELAWWPWLLAKLVTRGLSNVRIERRNFLTAPLERADGIYCYLITEAMAKLGPLFERRLKPGATVYSYAFRLPGWTEARAIVDPGHPRAPRLWVYVKGSGSRG